MIVKIGVDIVDINRIEAIYLKHKQVFLNRILTQNEQDYCFKDASKSLSNTRLSMARVAKRFAAKEAFSKCIGSGIGVISFLDIEILNNNLNAPYIRLTDEALNYLKVKKGWQDISIDVSLSDDANMAIANVLVYARNY